VHPATMKRAGWQELLRVEEAPRVMERVADRYHHDPGEAGANRARLRLVVEPEPRGPPEASRTEDPRWHRPLGVPGEVDPDAAAQVVRHANTNTASSSRRGPPRLLRPRPEGCPYQLARTPASMRTLTPALCICADCEYIERIELAGAAGCCLSGRRR
jgi:hypothetical protein